MVIRSSLKQHGYLFVDHRASPGLSEDIARQAGYDPALVKEGKVYEADTLTCSHCKSTVVKNPFRTRARENCPKCNHHYICDGCYIEMQMPEYTHLPYDKKVDLVLDGKTYASIPIPLREQT